MTTHCLEDPYILTLLFFFTMAFLALGFGFGWLSKSTQMRKKGKL